MSSTVEAGAVAAEEPRALRRDITWTGAFWVASGVPALVLFSIGGIGATVGALSWLVWTISVWQGFLQSFTYAEIAGIFPGKSGGASVYGAIAWIRYSRFVAPLSTWCNWFAWSPVLALGTALCAGYIINYAFGEESSIATWSQTLVPLGGLKDGLELRINSVFFLGAAILLAVFLIQHYGIRYTSRWTMVLGVVSLLPLILIGIVPIFTGDVVRANYLPDPYVPISGAWDMEGWKLFIGGLFIAAWSTYAFETSVCYTSELKNPQKDTIKAIVSSGILCLFVFMLVPFSFQGYLGVEGMLEPGIYSGFGVGEVMADMLGGGTAVTAIVIIMLILALLLSVMTAMGGSSRTIYQASVDGWFPKYMSHVNKYGAPTAAMWTDLGFNLFLLLFSDYVFVLAVSNGCYMIFNFLNLNAGWIHRIDSGHVKRPWRCPTPLLAFNTFLAFVNAAYLGIGANVWGAGTLLSTIVWAALIIPVFAFRHWVTDKGKFPEHMYDDLGIKHGEAIVKKAGAWPYIALVGGAAVVAVGAYLFWNY
jgi:amino acid transporter